MKPYQVNWFFRMLKQCWDKSPKVFISDEDESIHQGETFYFLFIIFHQELNKILTPRSVYVAGMSRKT